MARNFPLVKRKESVSFQLTNFFDVNPRNLIATVCGGSVVEWSR